MYISKSSFILFIFTFLIIILPVNAKVIYEHGSIIEEIEMQKNLTLKKHTEQYKELSLKKTKDVIILADFFNIGTETKKLPFLQKNTVNLKIQFIAAKLDKLNYDFIIFKDVTTDQIYYELREKINKQKHGWGTYIFNPEYAYNTLIECPHPRYDKLTWKIGAYIFSESNSKGFLLSGAHRFTNKRKKGNLYGNSDVAHIKRSVFQVMHIAWCSKQTSTYQIHGFSSKKYKNHFSERTDVVISSGEGIVTKEIFILNKYFRTLGKKYNNSIHCHVASESSKYSLINITVNRNNLILQNTDEKISGTKTLNKLAATDNRQGKYCIHYIKSPFIHIEVSSDLRFLSNIHPSLGRITIDSIVKTIKTTANKRQVMPPKYNFSTPFY